MQRRPARVPLALTALTCLALVSCKDEPPPSLPAPPPVPPAEPADPIADAPLAPVLPLDAECLGAKACGDACRDGDAASCHALAELHRADEALAGSLKRARQLYEEACRAGHGAACLQAAMAETEDEAARLLRWKRAEALLKAGCDKDHGPACLRLAMIAGQADVATPGSAARELFHKACLVGDATSCLYLGTTATDAPEAERDANLRRAAKLFGDTCEAAALRRPKTTAAACRSLARMTRVGQGVVLDATRAALLDGKAIDILAESCAEGEEVACWDAASLIRAHYKEAGKRGRGLLKRACELGHVKACQDLKRRRKRRGTMYDL